MTKTKEVTETQSQEGALNGLNGSSDTPKSPSRRRLHWAVDAAILIMLFSALLKIWLLVGIAAMTLLGMFACAVWNKDPVYRWIGVRGLASALVCGAVAAVMSFARH